MCRAAGAHEIALADTIGVGVPADVRRLFGVGVPADVRRLFGAVREVSTLPLRAHFHNTRNTGYANAVAAEEAGVVALDASAGGSGATRTRAPTPSSWTPTSVADLEAIAGALPDHVLLANMSESGLTPHLSAKQFHEFGFGVGLFSNLRAQDRRARGHGLLLRAARHRRLPRVVRADDEPRRAERPGRLPAIVAAQDALLAAGPRR